MIRILSIVWYKVLPPRFGGQQGTAFFNSVLARHHSLVCLGSRNNEPTHNIPYKLLPELPVSKLQFINPLCWLKIIRTARKEKCTHIILEHPYHGIAGYLAKKLMGARLIIHSHNIEFLRFKGQYKWWWRLLFTYEKWVHTRADLNLFKTETDQAFSIGHFKLDMGKCMIVPFGVEEAISRHWARAAIHNRHQVPETDKILLFAGTLDYKPNACAVEAIFKEILPRLLKCPKYHFKIIICGRNKLPSFQYLKKMYHPNVMAAGEVEDIENYFEAADVFINPVTLVTGVQTKTMEALSHHRNVVCFQGGCEEPMAESVEGKLLLARDNDWDDFAHHVISASECASSHTPLSFFKKYGWEGIIQPVSDRIRQL